MSLNYRLNLSYVVKMSLRLLDVIIEAFIQLNETLASIPIKLLIYSNKKMKEDFENKNSKLT